ncbi:MAG TPA: hypothetical protein VE664_02975 [Actinomycetes bacterium]|jgi:hypothetical protein|nr:hypothetical protein [Actinomycetes bacterium]
MTYRYLPWSRRGLAAEITNPDPLGPTMATRASFGVRVNLSTGAQAAADVRLYGPGDVIGVDPRVIVRLEPHRFTPNAEPGKLAAIEFDPPDFPWMFTPAAAGASDRLRPWCVLVVVAAGAGVRIDVSRDRPLPRLTIESPAVPDHELPDLAESSAWAHAQVLDDGGGGPLPQQLAERPNLNVSRLLCPRRLEPDRDWLACLVPAFEVGRLAGLGQPVPDAATTDPAWASGAGAPATVVLPVYFHWEFHTGPEGDFESLARRLTPQPLPEGVGTRTVFIGAADPALPRLGPAAPGAVLALEGALVAPRTEDEQHPGPSLDDVPAAVRDALQAVLDAPASHVEQGADPDAEAVGPPLYGQWHVRQHTIPAQQPRWFRELNLDPRERAQGGLGAEVVRANQEDYMDAAWRQVGDVLAANRQLDLARLGRELAARVHARHIVRLDPDRLFQLTTPVHSRVLVGNRTVHGRLGATVLPPGATDPSFRRMTSAQSAVLKRATRLAGGDLVGGGVPVAIVGELAAGTRRLEPVAGVPDGLVSSSLLDVHVGDVADDAPVTVLEGLAEVSAGLVRQAVRARDQLAGSPPQVVAVRPDLGITGIILDRHIGRLADGLGGRGSLTTAIGTLLNTARANRDAVGFVLETTDTGLRVRPLHLEEGTVTVPTATGSVPVARVAPLAVDALGREAVGQALAALPAGAIDLSGAAPAPDLSLVPIERPQLPPGPGPVPGPGEPPGPVHPPVPPLDAPVRDLGVIGRFTAALSTVITEGFHVEPSTLPAPVPLQLAQLKATLVAATEPTGLITRRAAARVKIGGVTLDGLGAGAPVRVGADLDPVLAFPDLARPVYADLARYDSDRLLPGAGLIPADAVTLLETNQRFVEALLVGMNHEMNRELLWREYPTDRRGTPLRRFWDRHDGAPDIPPIHQWDPAQALGRNATGPAEGSLVLLVRGQLLRRYPNSIVYAAPALPNGRLNPAPTVVKLPAFGGRLEPDITFAGFDLTAEQVEPEPGWFFVIQEQATEPRFGLDEPDPEGDPSLASWSDLTWGHAGVAPGAHLRIAGSPLAGRTLPLAPPTPDAPGAVTTATFATNAAHVAAITFQRPFRAAIHSRRVLSIRR